MKPRRNEPGQLPLFQPQSTWRPPAVASLPAWHGASRVAIDIETSDPDLKKLGPGPRRNGFITGIAFAIEDGPAHYLPIAHAEDNLDKTQVFSYLRDQFSSFRGELVGAYLAYELSYLLHEKIAFHPSATFRDVGIAAPLISEIEESYSLQAISTRLGLAGKDETLLNEAARQYGVTPKGGMPHIPARFVAPYAIQDVRLPLEVFALQRPLLAAQKLDGIFELESKCLPVLARMQNLGVAIDQKQLDFVDRWSVEQELECLAKVKHLTGISLTIKDTTLPDSLERVFKAIGITPGRTKTGKPNIDANLFASVDHPVADELQWARKVNKLRTTFVESIRSHQVNGRIHCTMNQMAGPKDEDGKELDIKGARYGRLSSEHPNLQQQPSRDEFAKMWRSIYIPDGDGLWCSADYSQQEPRLTTHYAVRSECKGADVAAQAYRDDPKTDTYDMMAKLTGLDRKSAKTIYLGLCYGMQGPKLAQRLGLPTELIEHRFSKRKIRVAGVEAQAILDKFNMNAPFIGQLSDKCKALANKRGFIVTLLGRRCHFPKDAEGNYDGTYRALNRLIQGSAADQTKAAMVAVDECGIRLQLQVHDELDTTVSSETQGRQIGQIMAEVVRLEVPMRVDVKMGTDWGNVK